MNRSINPFDWFRDKGFSFSDKITVRDIVVLQNDSIRYGLNTALSIVSASLQTGTGELLKLDKMPKRERHIYSTLVAVRDSIVDPDEIRMRAPDAPMPTPDSEPATDANPDISNYDDDRLKLLLAKILPDTLCVTNLGDSKRLAWKNVEPKPLLVCNTELLYLCQLAVDRLGCHDQWLYAGYLIESADRSRLSQVDVQRMIAIASWQVRVKALAMLFGTEST